MTILVSKTAPILLGTLTHFFKVLGWEGDVQIGAAGAIPSVAGLLSLMIVLYDSGYMFGVVTRQN